MASCSNTHDYFAAAVVDYCCDADAGVSFGGCGRHFEFRIILALEFREVDSVDCGTLKVKLGVMWMRHRYISEGGCAFSGMDSDESSDYLFE